MRSNELWTCPRDGPVMGQAHVINGTVVGPFEEEEEGTGITSDVVKV